MKLLLKYLVSAGLAFGLASAADARRQSYPNWARVQPGSAALAQRLVAAHNAVRASAGTQPLAWDAALAAGAQAYAQQLAATGAFQHSDRRARPGIGENLWMGTSGAFSPEQMVGNGRWKSSGSGPAFFRTSAAPAIGSRSAIIRK